MILGSAAAALGVAGGVSLASEAGIGPIYKFEEPGAGSGLPLDYNVAAMERFSAVQCSIGSTTGCAY